MNTSLLYEVLLYLNSFYFGMFGVCEVGIAFFKYARLPYPPNAVITELLLLLILCVLEMGRVNLGRRGNLCDRAIPVLISILLIIPSSTAVVYFLLWQAYVLRLEVILCSIQLVIHATELIFAFLCFTTKSKPNIL